MRFLINKSGNNFGDITLKVFDSKLNQSFEYYESEGSHSIAWKQAKVLRLDLEDKTDLLKCIRDLEIIQSKPFDLKLLKQEFRDRYSTKIEKTAKLIMKLEYDIQLKIIQNL